MGNKLKDWTVLIYANGTNEYEPEMYQCMLDAEKSGSNKDVNVVIEIGREGMETLKIMRPELNMHKNKEEWTGVRRYFLSNSGSILVKSMGNINMAHPKKLYNFLDWGLNNFPARHYMIILSGHGAAFIGAMTDLNQNPPCIMGTVEMCRVINMACQSNNKHVDLLILDSCYMNQIEVLYELGFDVNHGVQNFITYIEKGPLSGLPYGKLIDIIKGGEARADLDFICREIVEGLNYNLISVRLNQGRLKKIKRLSSSLAQRYLESKVSEEISLEELLFPGSDSPWQNELVSLRKELSSLVSYCNNIYHSEYVIDIVSIPLKQLINVYYKLSFAKNNYWTNLLNNGEIMLNLKPELKPTILSPSSILALILNLNPEIPPERSQSILNKLICFKGWVWK